MAAGFLGGHGGELGETVHSAGIFTVQVVFRLETFNFGGEFGVEALGIEGGDEVDSRLPLRHTGPGRLEIQSQRANHAHARDKHAPVIVHTHSQLLFQFQGETRRGCVNQHVGLDLKFLWLQPNGARGIARRLIKRLARNISNTITSFQISALPITLRAKGWF